MIYLTIFFILFIGFLSLVVFYLLSSIYEIQTYLEHLAGTLNTNKDILFENQKKLKSEIETINQKLDTPA